jgi:sterol desaturase/sphingolipid hydroxylase (fatty acid hydroxylase superfamily)
MDTSYGRAVALAVPIFLTLIAIEIILDRARRTQYYRLADTINSLSCGIASTGMRVFFGFLAIFTYEWTLVHWAPVRLSASHWLTWVFAFVFYDFCYYWSHRAGHRVGLFWASHVVHHQSEEFNLTTALRQTATGNFTGWIFYIPMALCGIPLGVVLVVGLVQLFYQFWPHTRVIGRLGFLDRWVQTPSNHRVHHAQNDLYLDRNYVGVFLIWDRWFGTFQEERDDEPCIYGIRGQLHSWNPVWANLHYFWMMAKDSWHAQSWFDKVRVWFAPPGWRPADAAARFPKKDYDPRVDFVKFDPARHLALSLYVLVQFVVVIAANSHLLALVPTQPAAWNIVYFGFILSSLVTVGGLLENRRKFLYAEAVRIGIAGVTTLVAGSWFGGVNEPRAVLALVSFALVSLAWLLLAARATREVSPLRTAAFAGR